MAIDRTERLLDLVFALMGARRAVSRSQIQHSIPGYDPGQSPAAFERMFERDKDELRAMGIPIETVVDANGEVEGYRIRPEEYAVPPLSFDAEEAAVLAVAAAVWDDAVLGADARTALRKLEAAAGLPVAARGHDGPSPLVRHSADDAAILGLLAGVRSGRRVAFGYRSADGIDSTRTVDPWGVVARQGAWYLVGHDADRDAVRAFRVSRMTTPVSVTRDEVRVARPDGFSLASAVDPDDRGGFRGRMLLRAGAAGALRRRFAPDADPRADITCEVTSASLDRFVQLACAAGDGAVVLDPPEARAAVIARLRAVAEAHA